MDSTGDSQGYGTKARLKKFVNGDTTVTGSETNESNSNEPIADLFPHW